MSYRVNLFSSFILDGDYTNAGERMFLRDNRLFIVDGVELGTAAERQFLKDLRAFVISGQGVNQEAPHVTHTAVFEVMGRTHDARIHAAPNAFLIGGKAGPQSINVARYAAAFLLDTVPQETPP